MSRPHQLLELCIGDDAEAWAAAGFAISDGATSIGAVRIRFSGTAGARGIQSAAIADPPAALDGLGLHHPGQPANPLTHPNGVQRIDHLVVATPDCDRTTEVLEAASIEARRVRQFDILGITQRQTFFWLGDVILELVGPDVAAGDEPATFWGLALVAEDLDATANALHGHCSPPKDAVQPGRRITTITTRDLGISVPLAVMSP